MKKLLLLLALLCIEKAIHAQTRPPYIYTIKADSVLITNSCDTAELILENHTQNVPGFLFNKGRGRTEFRRALQKINDSIYLVGNDTLKLSGAWLQGGNTFGTTGILGTRDNNHLDFITNNTQRGRFTSAGNLLLGTTTDDGNKLQVLGSISLIGAGGRADIASPTYPVLIGDEATGGGTAFLFNGDATGRPIIIGGQNSNNFHKFRFQTLGQGGDSIATYNFTYNSNQGHALNIFNGADAQTKLLLTAPGNLLIGTLADTGYKLNVNGQLRAGVNTLIGASDPANIGGNTQSLKLYGNFQVVTGITGGKNGGFSITYNPWNRPGATTMSLNGVDMAAYDSKIYFGGANSGYFGVNTYGYNSITGGPFTRTKYTIGNDSDPSSYNDSYALFGVSDGSEFTNTSGYPSGANYYLLETRLSSPVVSANTNQIGVRAPLKIGARQLWFNTGNVEPGTEAMRITEAGNVLVGSTTDNGNKLQVNGNANVAGQFNVGGVFYQAAPQTAVFGNGIAFSSSGNLAVISAANNEIYYNSQSKGDQHFFQNTIGGAFTGSLVTLDPGYYPQLLDNQLALKVFGRMNIPGLAVNMLGYTGIGTFTPSAQLHTTGTVRFAGLTSDSTQTRVIVSDANGNLYYRSASSLALNDVLNSDLAVNGALSAQKMRITQTGPWPDYVFSNQYKLPTLLQLEQYIKQNNHLPDVPSATEVEKKGIDVGNNQAILLRKIEELTLYTIDQDKKLEKQNEKIADQEKKLQKQSEEITEIKNQLKMLMQKN